ncbi:MAG: electron transfer flavoprotein subunit alpha/FixB family protein [Deltaproteobacteria bacterium]|nr:electron transfer flavoprotein subunit alpha/FixB family protein [Deltaproteobacteria bacterium]
MSSVLVVTEISNGSIRDTSLELVAFARKVAEASGREVKSLVIGSDVEGAAGDFASKGGGETYVVDAPEVANYNVECFKKAILAAVEAGGADLVLLSNTPLGWDVAPRIAASLDCAFVSDCTNIEASDSGLTFTRRVFNGKLDAQLSAAGPAVATVQSGACEPFSGSSEGSVTKLDADLSGAKAKFIEIKMSENTGIDLTKADVVVSGGRGVGDPDKFKEVIQPLADVLGGAMGASRPVVDAGWLPHAHKAVHRVRDQRCNPASGGNEGLELHRCDQQGRRRADLRGRRCRSRGRSVRSRARTDRCAVRSQGIARARRAAISIARSPGIRQPRARRQPVCEPFAVLGRMNRALDPGMGASGAVLLAEMRRELLSAMLRAPPDAQRDQESHEKMRRVDGRLDR